MEYKLYRKVDDSLYYKYYIYSSKKIHDIENLLNSSFDPPDYEYVEIGPYESSVSSWSSNIMSMFNKLNIPVYKAERTKLIPFELDPYFDFMTEKIYNREPNFNYEEIFDENDVLPLKIEDINLLDFDDFEKEYYKKLFTDNPDIPLNNITLEDIRESNSEHSRHWVFNSKMYIDNVYMRKSLFQMVKDTQNYGNKNSTSAFCDNASSIRGSKEIFSCFPSGKGIVIERDYDISFTAETHNFPTAIEPFSGASTGVGGRIRDTQSIGTGGMTIAGTSGYCVSRFDEHRSIEILIKASDGVSDYGNKFGEPLINGFCRSYGNGTEGWNKPILFSGGIGLVYSDNVKKKDSKPGDLVVKVGGPAYPIGKGGGSSSSKETNMSKFEELRKSVQRGDPEMQNRVSKLLRWLTESRKNLIIKIHDQGAGGTANVTKEIVSPNGGIIELKNIQRGDTSMTLTDLWLCEYQEQVTIVIEKDHLKKIQNIAQRENVPLSVIGEITDSGRIQVKDFKDKIVIDLPLKDTLSSIPRKTFRFDIVKETPYRLIPYPFDLNLKNIISKVLSSLDVGSKRFLTNKVDRSVTGLIAGQQCVGPFHTPVSDHGIVVASLFGSSGAVTSIGERPLNTIYNENMKSMVHMSFAEMITNMAGACISDLRNIKCSGNWMWPFKWEGSGYKLYEACAEMVKLSSLFGIAFDGGKDSLSMIHEDEYGRKTKCPETLVISGYCDMPDVLKAVSPYFKKGGNDIIFVDLGFGHSRLGGSVFLREIFNNENPGSYKFPILEENKIKDFCSIFKHLQDLIREEVIVSLHDRSDGGLITTLTEMCISGNLGAKINLKTINHFEYLFNEEPGIVIEVIPGNIINVLSRIGKWGFHLGTVCKDKTLTIYNENTFLYNETLSNLKRSWEQKSYELELLQCEKDCVNSEFLYLLQDDKKYHYRCEIKINKINVIDSRPKIAIIRDEGSNGERELANAFLIVGFEVYDITSYDLLNDKSNLYGFKGIAFAGGFTYSDAVGAGKCWSNILQVPSVKTQLSDFYKRSDTFSLGICNGCQVMVRLGLFGNSVKLETNNSGRFESRFPCVRAIDNNIFFKGFKHFDLGIWTAHKEGRFDFEDSAIGKDFNICLQYIDRKGPTMSYPLNPNGSKKGVAGITSINGRHMAMMPHPERSIMKYQFPTEREILGNSRFSFWIQMFFNAIEFQETDV